ncbi:MAG: outer membrane protein assembly factor BamD [Micavibrio sp.]|nr:outer membrane protein assembly factor BamD [Micavibrio sp.]HCK32984.1 outer membrane protein assembly factor BamD [Rhodospirillaceae bacterium]
MRFYQILMLLTVSVLAVACSSGQSTRDKEEQARIELESKSAEEIYQEAMADADKGLYINAAKMFNEVERLYPYSDLAPKAQLQAAYAYYKSGKYDDAVIGLDRYIQLYPGSDDLDYAYYLRALNYYDQIVNVERDQAMTESALDNLNLLINRFPDSRYARDAEYKRDLTMDHLAGKEMEIGRYYLTRGYYQAGINRFMNVVEKYQTTTHVPEALHRLVESYLALGIEIEAYRVAAVLGHNYPGSPWYEDTYKLLDPKQRQKLLNDRSFVDKAVETIFRPQ